MQRFSPKTFYRHTLRETSTTRSHFKKQVQQVCVVLVWVVLVSQSVCLKKVFGPKRCIEMNVVCQRRLLDYCTTIINYAIHIAISQLYKYKNNMPFPSKTQKRNVVHNQNPAYGMYMYLGIIIAQLGTGADNGTAYPL